jgi:hypothetical protein
MAWRRFALALLLLVSVTPSANSIVNGAPAVGSNYVITLLSGNDNESSYCTGAYLRPRVVVTAAHCVIKAGGRAPELGRAIENYYVSQPGVDWTTAEARKSKVRVLKIWTVPDYFNRWEPEKRLFETQVDDVAFLFLERELNGPTLSRAATRDEIEQYRQGNQGAFHLGYGCIGDAKGEVVGNDGKPYLVEGITGNFNLASHIPIRDRQLSVDYPKGQSLCPGDSGSPLMMKKGDEVLYIGTLYAGGGWGEIARGDKSVRGVGSVTVLWPYIPTLDEEWKKFLVEEQSLKDAEIARAKAAEEAAARLVKEREDAILNASFYKDSTGCHSRGINSELQAFIDGRWQVVANARGWDAAPNCPSTNPVQPWVITSLPEGLQLRWRFWIPNGFDVFGPVFPSQMKPAPIPTPTPTPTPSASATPTPIPLITVAPAKKKITITCVKGKQTKKVSAINPKCPAGFKRK